MNNLIRTTVILGLIFVLIGHISGQVPLTLEECRTQAISYNKQLKKAGFREKEAIAEKKAVRTTFLPTFEADANFMHIRGLDDISTEGGFLPTAASAEEARQGIFTGISDVWMPGMTLELDNMTVAYGGISISQPLFAGGKIITANKMADVGVEMADMAYDLKYSEVIERTDEAFWNVAMVEANIALAEKYIEMLTETEGLMISMYEVGLQPASEKLKVTVQKNEAELQLLVIRNNLKIAKMNLNQLLGHDLEKPVLISYDSLLSPSIINMDNGVQLAYANRNELKLLEKQVTLTELDKRMILGDYLPQMGVGFQLNSTYVNNYAEDFDFTPIVAAQLSIPIFQWGQGYRKQQAAKMRIKQQEMELSRTSDLVALEVHRTKVKVEEAFEAIHIAKKNIVAAEESLEETKSSFEVGLNNTTDLLNAQANWLNAKAQHILAFAKYKVLETTWLRVTGQLASGE
jgi:outer membrane protein